MKGIAVDRTRILVAGIGNIFLGDDGFGCEVARRLAGYDLPAEVRVVDFGIRGFDLGYALLEDYELIVLIDATPRGGVPGTLYQVEPEFNNLDLEQNSDPATLVETHNMVPTKVLAFAKFMGATLRRMVVIGCEPEVLGEDEEGRIGLSPPVAASIDGAVSMVESLIDSVIGQRARDSVV